MNKNIGIIGCGNMGTALVEYIKKNLSDCRIYVFDKEPGKGEALARRFQVSAAQTARDLILDASFVIVAVKPQDINDVLTVFQGFSDKVLISIAAGTTISYIETVAGSDMPVIRAMPNLNALIGRSVTAIAANERTKKEDLDFARRIFECAGDVVFVAESQLNAVTAISGSGPAFVAYLEKEMGAQKLESLLEKKAIELHIEPDTARILASATVKGTLAMLSVNFDADVLIKRVSSKGGTTEAGMKVLTQKGKTEEALEEAIDAACLRAAELSRTK